MFHDDYLNKKRLRDKLLKKIDAREKQINQAVSIRDIMVYPESIERSYGETPTLQVQEASLFSRIARSLIPSHILVPELTQLNVITTDNRYQQYNRVLRLIDHIDVLAQITNQYHLKYYNKPGSENKITRLLLNEFSLYTTDPLDMNEFSLLLDAIYSIARQQQENVHLLLSSMAVMAEPHHLLNISIYVQCGSDPKLNVFAKGWASPVDVMFLGVVNFSQNKLSSEDTLDAITISEYVGVHRGIIISNNPVFTVSTAGGAEYTQAIDVCLDYAYSHAKKIFSRSLIQDVSHNQHIMPSSVDHVITSNTLTFEMFPGRIAEEPIQIDPIRNRAVRMENDDIQQQDLQHLKKNKYAGMSLTVSLDGLHIKNPPFGSQCVVVATNERRLGNYADELRANVSRRNHEIKRKMLATLLSMTTHGPEYVKILNEYRGMVSQINKLTAHFYENVFNPRDYGKAKEALIKMINNLQGRDEVEFLKMAPGELNNLKENFKQLTANKKDALLEEMITRIDKLLAQLPSATPAYQSLKK